MNRVTNINNNYISYGGFGGYGWGGYGGYRYGRGFGFGYPYFGYGLGYGLFSPLWYGLGGYGYNNFGYAGYGGYGYPGSLNGYYYNPYGYGLSSYGGMLTGVAPAATVATAPATATDPAATGFAEKGEAAFKAGDYAGAAYSWRHAVVDTPQNPVLGLMYAHALFATGKFDEAAGAVQAALSQLPKDKWGVVVSNGRELYGNYQDYTTHLRALEAAAREKPNDPALKYLQGYHYAYLGYPQQAIDQLEKVLSLVPQDEMAKQLRDEMKARLAGQNLPTNDLPPAPSTLVPAGRSNLTAMFSRQFEIGH